ncbi:MAG: DoxX family protein [Prevotellaceae bacterium]|nr:DoxX family protein [Prevotellaceae bacterium]
MKKIMIPISHASRILIGLLFVFSGYVKAIDPLGFTYKLDEYFESLNMLFLSPFALIISILIIAAELVMGLCLLARIRMKLVAWGVLLFMSFFTLLTFYIAIKGDVVKDCGCFGDALVLSNIATFLKNLAAMPFVIFIFFWRKNYTHVAKCNVEWLIAIMFFALTLGIELYCLRNLPIIDFMPYKAGTNIPKNMEYPEDAQPDEYKTTYYYSKNGETKKFDDTNYPWNDSTWTYVDTKSELVKKGYEPPIHDFEIHTEDGEDITADIVYSEKFTFIFILRKVEKADISDINKINEIADYCRNSDDFDFYACSSSAFTDVDKFIEKTNATYRFCFGDETAIKTMLRSNQGLMLIKDGNILAKWSYLNIPTIDEIKKLAATDYQTIIASAKAKERNTTIILAAIALIFICFINTQKYKI